MAVEERGVRWVWLLLPFAAAPLISVAGYKAGRERAAQAVRHHPLVPLKSPSREIVVHVSGAVKRPGAVRLLGPARAMDALKAAGGATSDADLDSLNLAAFVKDGQKLVVPRKEEKQGEREAAGAGEAHETGRKGKGGRPSLSDRAELRRLERLVSRLERLLGSGSQPPVSPSRPVDINLASEREIALLPGVGPSLARAVVEWRNRNGPFKSVDQLLLVPGIGPKTLERLRPLVVARPRAKVERSGSSFPVDVNLATREELAFLPGIGPSLAAEIVRWREEHGPFRSVEELTEVPGIGPRTLWRLKGLVKAGRPKEPLNLITASLEEIASLPGISREAAEGIVELRAEGGLKDERNLLEVEGITEELLRRLEGWLEVRRLREGEGRRRPPSERPSAAGSGTASPPLCPPASAEGVSP